MDADADGQDGGAALDALGGDSGHVPWADGSRKPQVEDGVVAENHG